MNEDKQRGESAKPPQEPREKDKSGDKQPPPVFERPTPDGPPVRVRRQG